MRPPVAIPLAEMITFGCPFTSSDFDSSRVMVYFATANADRTSVSLILWYPAFFTRFMPGWVINIAHIIHSDEALLAAGFIFSIHFFNTHFRIEKFPMDTVIFSGRVSKTELMHERKRWYDRLVASGTLDQHRVRDEWFQWKNIARSFGYLFFGVGVILLLLIIYAMVSRLAH